MVITREDLNNMYLEHIEAEKVRLAKLIDEDFRTIIQSVLQENNRGLKQYQRTCYETSELYMRPLLSRLQEIFVDAKILLESVNNESSVENQRVLLLTINWSIN
jgi:hypothetical protein